MSQGFKYNPQLSMSLRSITLRFAQCISILFAVAPLRADNLQTVKLWEPLVLTFNGPEAMETADTFRNYRMDVTFSHGERSVTAPGYFAADGDAANTGANSGDKWRVKFTPDAIGEWTYRVSFRTGEDIAVSSNPKEGKAVKPIDGQSGRFEVLPTVPDARGFFAKGQLRYVGEHYLQHQGTGEWFVKAGAGSPEDFLGYAGFDGTYDRGSNLPDDALGEDGLHNYAPHINDWREGDPTWGDGRGKGIIGALNYLAEKGCNTIYNVLITLNGDADTTWPWVDPVEYPEGEAPEFEYKRTKYSSLDVYDVSKLEQWDIVFSHMDRLGINHDTYLTEQENTTLLNGDQLGVETKLYFREMAARFSYHLSWRWNIGEEPHDVRPPEMSEWMKYLQTINIYDHPVGHHCSGKRELRYDVYDPQLGKDYMDAAFLQINEDYHQETLKYVKASREAGKKWVVPIDEPNRILPGNDDMARESFWKIAMAGGEGLGVYVAYQLKDYTDITIEDFRRMESVWEVLKHGVDFFQIPEINRELPKLVTQNELIRNGYCFAEKGNLYIVWTKHAAAVDLDLSDADGTYSVRWYDPRNGGGLQKTANDTVEGGKPIYFGTPPTGHNEWIVVVQRVGDEG